MRQETVYERTTLYRELWAEPAAIVARRYQISGVALGKICKKLRVPVPGRGYWARKRAGQSVRRTPLPSLRGGEKGELTVVRWVAPAPPPPSVETADAIAQEKVTGREIVVSDHLERPHKWVAISARHLRKGRSAGFRPVELPCLDVDVSAASLDRALRILDALLRAFDDRGFELHVGPPAGVGSRHDFGPEDDLSRPGSRVKVRGQWIRFVLSEKIHHRRAPEQTRHGHDAPSFLERLRRPPTELVPSGLLSFSLHGVGYTQLKTTWRDGVRRRLEDCLAEIVAGLYLAADSMRSARAEAERRRKDAEERAERERAEARRVQAEEEARRDLESIVADWRFARDVRDFIADARALVASANLTMAEGMDAWLKDAAAVAENVDPLSKMRRDVADIVAARAAPPRR